MARKGTSSSLPGRISGYFLLLFAGALLWIAAGAITLWLSHARRQADEAGLYHLHRISGRIQAGDVRQGRAHLQSLIERTRAEGNLVYGCIVSPEGRILAHCSPAMVDQIYREPAASSVRLNGAERLRWRDESAASTVLEYRALLRDGAEKLGSVHLAFREPGYWKASFPGSVALIWVAAGPAVCLGLGMLLLRRALAPVAAIESQLARAVVAVCPTELDLDEVPAGGTAALGWNRLVQAHQRRREQSDLDQRATVALREASAGHGHHVLNSLPDGVALTDESGHITFANLAMGAICGVGDGDGLLTGETVDGLFALHACGADAQTLLAANSHGRTVAADVRITRQGSPRVLRITRHPYWGIDGQADPTRQVWTVRDMTQQQLVAQTRDQFLETAAHELRTPLANIKAYAETLSLDETIDTGKQKEFYNVINAEAARLARLIEDLLSVSSMEAGALSATREETDLGRLFTDVIDKVKTLMDQKELELETALPPKWPKMHLDKDKIATSLVNVLGNAAKYTPAGGRVTLRVTVQDSQVTVTVEDSGIGIAAEELPRISEKFFRSSDPRVRQQTGSGLGLSLVKEVVRLHGGSLDIRSEAEQGTTVKITLPIG